MMVCCAVLVLGIDVSAAESLHDIDEVQLNHTRDVAPVGVARRLAGLVDDFQIDAGGECYHILTRTVVAVLLLGLALLPVPVGSGSIRLAVDCYLVASPYLVLGVCDTYGVECDIAGEVAEVVHDAVDTEVVAVQHIFLGRIVAALCLRAVQGHLAHTVDGVVGVVGFLGHAVAGTLEHHTAAPDTHEVGTLHGVQQTSGIERAEAGFLPIGFVAVIGCSLEDFLVFGFFESVSLRVGLLVVSECLLALILQLEVGTFAVALLMVLLQGNLVLEAVEVGAVVGDVQLAEAIHEGEVAVAVETADVLRTDGDEVAVVHVAQRCRGIAEDGVGVHEDLVTTHRDVAAREDGVVDDDTGFVVYLVPV